MPGTTKPQQAAMRQRRREAGWKKLSFYLEPGEVELLNRLKARHGTDKAAVTAALRIAAET